MTVVAVVRIKFYYFKSLLRVFSFKMILYLYVQGIHLTQSHLTLSFSSKAAFYSTWA